MSTPTYASPQKVEILPLFLLLVLLGFLMIPLVAPKQPQNEVSALTPDTAVATLQEIKGIKPQGKALDPYRTRFARSSGAPRGAVLNLFLLSSARKSERVLSDFARSTSAIKEVSSSTTLTIPIDTITEPKSIDEAGAVTITPSSSQKTPEARLMIPEIGVDATIQEMGLTLDGAMAVPNNRVDVGWFSLGTRPGDIGSAVIGGHSRFDSATGVFGHLYKLKKDDTFSIVDAKGISTSFIVRDIRIFDAADINTGIFASESGAHLNLITCSGDWDPSTKSYKERLVVFTDVVQATSASLTLPDDQTKLL